MHVTITETSEPPSVVQHSATCSDQGPMKWKIEFAPTCVDQVSEISYSYSISELMQNDTDWSIKASTAAYLKQQNSDLPHFRVMYPVFASALKTADTHNNTVMMSFQFRPREAGSYMQCWQLKMEPALASAATAGVLLKFDLCGQGIPALQSSESSVLSTRTLSDMTAARSRTDMITVSPARLDFSSTWSVYKLKVANHYRSEDVTVTVEPLPAPFYCTHKRFIVTARHYTRVMVECRPVEPGCYTGVLCLLASTGVKLNVPLTAQCVRETAI